MGLVGGEDLKNVISKLYRKRWESWEGGKERSWGSEYVQIMLCEFLKKLIKIILKILILS